MSCVTADGGQTWSGQPLKALNVLAADYRPDGHIWLEGQTATGGREDGVLLHSPDNGRTWTAYRAPAFGPSQLSFTSATDGWLAASAGGHQALLVTHDGGATWQETWPTLQRP